MSTLLIGMYYSIIIMPFSAKMVNFKRSCNNKFFNTLL